MASEKIQIEPEQAIDSAYDVMPALKSLNKFIGTSEESERFEYNNIGFEGLLIGSCNLHIYSEGPDSELDEEIWPTTDIDIFTAKDYTDWDKLPVQGREGFYRDRTNTIYAGLNELIPEDLRYDVHVLTDLGPSERDRSRDNRMLEEEIELGGYTTLIDDHITVYLATLDAQFETMRNSEKYSD